MDQQQLHALIALGEDQHTDFKDRFVHRKEFFPDEVVVEQSTLADLDQEQVVAYIAEQYGPDLLEEVPLEQLLGNLELADRAGDEITLTVTGLLLFGARPQQLLPYTRISAVSFVGTELEESAILLSQEIEGRLDQMIEQANLFLARNKFVTSECRDGSARINRNIIAMRCAKQSLMLLPIAITALPPAKSASLPSPIG